MQRKFSNKQLAIIINNITELKESLKIINNKWYEDVSLVDSKLYHGVYNNIFKEYKLAIGLTDGYCELLAQEYFLKHNYELCSYDDFVKNLNL